MCSVRGTKLSGASLHLKGIQAEFYHANMDPAEKSAVQQRFMANETSAICATAAFGMGIDKPDVRLVVHVGAPKTIESYQQAS